MQWAVLSVCAASRMWDRHRSVVIVPPEGGLESRCASDSHSKCNGLYSRCAWRLGCGLCTGHSYTTRLGKGNLAEALSDSCKTVYHRDCLAAVRLPYSLTVLQLVFAAVRLSVGKNS